VLPAGALRLFVFDGCLWLFAKVGERFRRGRGSGGFELYEMLRITRKDQTVDFQASNSP
jgi:hypothetical protein